MVEESMVSRKMRPTIVPKEWGYEQIITNHRLYCGKMLTVTPNGNACSLHYHKVKHETFHVIRGLLNIQVIEHDGDYFLARGLKTYILSPGSSIAMPPLTAHRFWVDNEICDFIETSTQDFAKDSIRLVKSGPKPPTLVHLEKQSFKIR